MFKKVRFSKRGLTAVCVVGLAAMALAACGSSSKSSGASSKSTSSISASSGANIAAAKAAIAPYVGHPNAFPVSTPLKGKLPAGTKIAFLECGTPICALVKELLAPAVKTVGGTLSVINSGTTAQSSQAAAASVLAEKPAALLVTGTIPSEYGGELAKIQAAGTKVVSISVAGPTKQYGITFNYVGLDALEKAGRLLADWVIANKGPKANVVFYGVPELAFNPYMESAFKAELARNCSSCNVRFSSIDITAFGTTAPQTIAGDLQSHPSTNTAVFESAELAAGLPAALKAANINVTTLGYVPQPEELEQIKDGQMTAGLASDIATQMWTSVDVVARLLLNQSPTAGETQGFGPDEFLTQKQITFNPAMGWTGYPDVAQRYAKLWNASS